MKTQQFVTLRDIPYYTDFPLTAEVGLYKNTNKGKESDGMKTKAIAGIILALFMTSFLCIAFNVVPVIADPEGLLFFETDKSVYTLGEPVIITLTNIGDAYVPISGWPSCMIYTYNVDPLPVWPKIFAPLIWGLSPGESETWTWDQYNEYTLSPAEPGMYIVKFHGDAPAEVNEALFEIEPAVAKLKLNPSVIEDTSLGPCSLLMIAVEIHGVEHMFGYEFELQWNPNILEFVNYMPTEPFVFRWSSTATPGESEQAWSYFIPETEGFTPPPCTQYPVGIFIFHVKGWGYSELDLKHTILTDVYGEEIYHTVLDGYFINVPPVVEADLTAWKAKAEYQPNWDTSDDDTNTLKARVWNKGSVDLNVKVVFTITKGAFSITLPEAYEPGFTLKPGYKGMVYYPLAFEQLDGYGKYHVSAQVSYWKITESQPPTPNGATIKTFWFEAVDP